MTDEQAIEPAKSFQERLKDRIRESIGELMSDEDLYKLVERGVEDVFFSPRTVKTGHGGYPNTKELPPLINEVVQECLNDRMNKAVAEWLASHETEVSQAVSDCVRDGAGAALLRGITSAFRNEMSNLEMNIQRTKVQVSYEVNSKSKDMGRTIEPEAINIQQTSAMPILYVMYGHIVIVSDWHGRYHW